MKKTFIKNLIGRISVIFLIGLFAVFLCICIKFGVRCITEAGYFQSFESIDKMISENFLLKKEIIKTAKIGEDFITEDDYDNIYPIDGNLYYIPDIVDDLQIEQVAENIAKFSDKTDTQVYFSVVPSASSVYYEEFTLKDLPLQEKKSIESFYSLFSGNVRYITLYNTMRSSKNDYIYYRTDKKWTSYGAFCGYRKIIQKLGYTPTNFSDYTVKGMSADFYGDLYDESKVADITADCIEKYTSINGSKILYLNQEEYSDENNIYCNEYLNSSENALDYYLGNTNAVTLIETNVRSDNNLIIFKDDYANEMIEFLMQHYKEITVVDMNKMTETDYKQLCESGFDDYTEILFLCGYESLADSDFFNMIGNV